MLSFNKLNKEKEVRIIFYAEIHYAFKVFLKYHAEKNVFKIEEPVVAISFSYVSTKKLTFYNIQQMVI